MTVIFFPIVAIIALGLLYFLIKAGRAYRRLHGPMVVTCPETQQPAAVAVDTRHAVTSGLVGPPDLRLHQCSRWPERQGCGQECLRQIEQAPEDCMVRTMLSTWYEGKSCALCGRPIEPLHAWTSKPGFIDAQRKVTECTAVPVEQLPDMLATAQALCWSCEVTEEFRQRHPELVIDKPAFQAPAGHHNKVH